MKPTFCLISHGSLFYILFSWQHAVNLLRHLSTTAIGCQNCGNMCQVLFDKVWYLLIESLVIEYLCMCACQGTILARILIRTISSSQKESACKYSQWAGQADKWGNTLWKDFTAFNFINDMHWCACCDFKTALQTTSLQCSQQLSLYKWPTKVHYMS